MGGIEGIGGIEGMGGMEGIEGMRGIGGMKFDFFYTIQFNLFSLSPLQRLKRS